MTTTMQRPRIIRGGSGDDPFAHLRNNPKFMGMIQTSAQARKEGRLIPLWQVIEEVAPKRFGGTFAKPNNHSRHLS